MQTLQYILKKINKTLPKNIPQLTETEKINKDNTINIYNKLSITEKDSDEANKKLTNDAL